MKKRLSKILILIIMLNLLLILSGCSADNVIYDKQEIINSPSNKYKITLKYDYASRPYIFKDNKMIFEYKGSGFKETVYWDVKWISEDKLLLYIISPKTEKYSSEKYYININ